MLTRVHGALDSRERLPLVCYNDVIGLLPNVSGVMLRPQPC